MIATITRDQLRAAIKAGEVTLLEAVPPMSVEKEHLPGARHVPLDDFDVLVGRLVPAIDAPVVVYSANAQCHNSAIAAARLEAMGYTDVRRYLGGKQDWVEAGLPIES